MSKIKVILIYPSEFDRETKDFELTDIELIALNMSNKIGSEGKYFKIKEKIFEDTKEDGICMSIVLENSNVKN
ncbi:MAG: hypothetical protein M0Q88_08485 [Bacilli bacterium]|nr:hypothetical protein [Bacilli bacterium]